MLSKEQALGNNLVDEDTYEAWKSFKKGAYDFSANSYTVFDASWNQACNGLIKYYLDPRNFLTEGNIYQFMDQRDATTHSESTIKGITDKYSKCFMGHLGLSGRAFIPLILGFGCTVPAIMASRALETKKDRFRVMLITPFMFHPPIRSLFYILYFYDIIFLPRGSFRIFTVPVTQAAMSDTCIITVNAPFFEQCFPFTAGEFFFRPVHPDRVDTERMGRIHAHRQ